MTNHSPDFIAQSLGNALTATYDSLVLLCNFKKEFDKKEAESSQKHPKGLFTGQNTGTAGFCESKEQIDSFIYKKSLSNDPSRHITLRDILVELGNMSEPPSMQNSKVTWQLLDKAGLFTPPHFLDLDKKTTSWYNKDLGLPEYPDAVEYSQPNRLNPIAFLCGGIKSCAWRIVFVWRTLWWPIPVSLAKGIRL